MSHPLPSHDYAEPTYRSDSPHKDGGHSPKAKALKKAKLNKNQRMTSNWLKEAGQSFRNKGESPLSHLKRLVK